LFEQGARVVSILVRSISERHKESIMNRFLATTAIALLMGAAPALAQSPETPTSPPQEPSAQAPMEPSESSPPSAIPSEPSEPMKAPDQSSEAPKPILPDQNAQEPSAAPEQSAQGGAQFINEQKTDDILASTIIGKPAVNSQDEGIGDVNDLVTDRSGKIIAALIGVGGFLGIGEKNVAVRFEDLKLTPDENNETKVVLNVSKDTLASAPDYKTLKQKSVVEGSIKSDSDSDKTGSTY
jgi:PRC-barrel domain protein